MSRPDRAFVFADNHDNQRGHGGVGSVTKYADRWNLNIMI